MFKKLVKFWFEKRLINLFVKDFSPTLYLTLSQIPLHKPLPVNTKRHDRLLFGRLYPIIDPKFDNYRDFQKNIIDHIQAKFPMKETL